MNIKKSENRMKNKNFNVGLALLKIYLSFLVVNSHCFISSKFYSKLLLFFLKNCIHVPTYFMISFFFFHKTLISRDLIKYKLRFERLLIPYIVWPIIIWAINNLLNLFPKMQLKTYSLKDLKNQLLFGHSFMTVLWFQWDLIFVTIFFIIIELLFSKDKIFILLILEVFAYYFQYSNYNYILFCKYSYEIKYTIGRLFEIIPYSISGFIIAHLRFIEYLKKKKIKSISFFLILFIFVYNINIFEESKGFYYAGIKLHIYSLCIFIIFAIFSKNLIFKGFTKLIPYISNFTSGIYYLHVPVMLYFQNIFEILRKRTIFSSLLTYLICFCICLIGNKFFKNTRLNNLFK